MCISDQGFIVVVIVDIVDIFNLVLVKILVPISLFATDDTFVEELAHKEDDLDAAYDGKPGKESHRSSNETHL